MTRINAKTDTIMEEQAYLCGLNTPQRQAVEAIDGPVLILAGAGTGKTRVLTTRMAHILNHRPIQPWQILAVTFTNKAAQEMSERLQHLLSRPAEGFWLGTFHALSLRILRRHTQEAGLSSSFTILDADDQVRLIKQLIKEHHLDEKQWIPRVVASKISRFKDRALLPERLTGSEPELSDPLFRQVFLSLYKDYQEKLRRMNAVDFGDLILLTLELFRTHPDILKIYQNQFRYILVDEYQDTNVSQYLWLRLLAQGHHNICCVGDDDQSIYGWRGAEITNILRFEKDFLGAQVIRLEENYRSTPHILGAASGLIAKNGGRLGKTLWTSKNEGDAVLIRSLQNGDEEARFIGEEIEALQIKKESLSSMAVLVRASFQTRAFEDRFITLGLPYRVVGGARFYERQEIRDALAYLRLIVSEQDSLAFERIVNVPKRGIGEATLQTIHAYSRSVLQPLVASCQQLFETDEIKGKARSSLQHLITQLATWRAQLTEKKPSDFVKMVLDESGYYAMWLKDKSPEASGRIDNLKELIRAVGAYESIPDFLEHVSLVMDNHQQAEGDRVTVMTLHASKGLEFDTVFLAGWEEEIFPSAKALKEKGIEGLEEERRLAYVGVTRAKKRAIITYALSRRIYGGWQSTVPSRFIDELPTAHVRHVTHTHYFKSPSLRKQQVMHEAQNQQAYDEKILFSLHDRVFHMKFGYGKIVAVDGQKLDIVFEHTGLKKVMRQFVQKA